MNQVCIGLGSRGQCLKDRLLPPLYSVIQQIFTEQQLWTKQICPLCLESQRWYYGPKWPPWGRTRVILEIFEMFVLRQGSDYLAGVQESGWGSRLCNEPACVWLGFSTFLAVWPRGGLCTFLSLSLLNENLGHNDIYMGESLWRCR